MTSQVQLTEEQLKKVEKAFEELQRLHFHIGMKKPEEWLYRLKHVLKMLPKEMRKTALAHLMATGHIRLPIIKVVARKINWERLEKAFESFLQTLPEWQREKYEKLIAELKEKMAQLKGEYKNYEEFVQELQKIMGEVSKETVINLGPFLSSLASYLAEQGLSQSQIQNIIKEIENKVFGGPVNYYIVKNEQELENIIKKIGQILQQHGIQTYDVITKLLPIETKVVYTSPENIKKAIEYVFKKMGITLSQPSLEALANVVYSRLRGKNEVTLQELAQAISSTIENLLTKQTKPISKITVAGTCRYRAFEIENVLPSEIALVYKILSKYNNVHMGWSWGGIWPLVDVLKRELPQGWRVTVEDGECVIYTPSGGVIKIGLAGLQSGSVSATGEAMLELIKEKYPEVYKLIKGGYPEVYNLNEIKKAFLKYFEKTGVAAVPTGEFYRILEEGWKKKELPFKVESYVTYQKTVEIKVPTFYETLSKLAAKYAMGAGEVLERFRQWLEKEWKNITEAVTRPVYIEWRII